MLQKEVVGTIMIIILYSTLAIKLRNNSSFISFAFIF